VTHARRLQLQWRPAARPLQGLLLLAPAVDISLHWQQVAQPAGADAVGYELVKLPSDYVEVGRRSGLIHTAAGAAAQAPSRAAALTCQWHCY
jgi:hypothetical protein